VAAPRRAGVGLRPLPGGRQTGQWAIGAALGLYFSPEVVAQLGLHAPLVIAAALGSLVLGMAYAFILLRLGGVDAPTAFFAALPGGASEMANLADRLGGAVDRIAAAHAIRGMMVVSVLPCALTFAGVQGSDVYVPLAREVDAAGFSTAYTYDAERNPLTVTDARGKVWTYTYDAKGNTLTSKNPLNQTTTYTYNATNDLLTVTTLLGHVTTVNYNAQGRVTSVVDPLGRTTATATYNAFGDLTAVADALGRTATFNYNANGDATSSLSPAGVTSSATYDALGNMLSTTDAGLLHTAVFRDEWNRITTTQLPGNANVNVTYNGRSLVTAIVDPLGRVTTTQ